MIKLPRIKFVKSGLKVKLGNEYIKVFQLFFHTAEKPTKPYRGCFYHYDHNVDVDLIVGKNEKIYLGRIKPPMIVVTKQDSFFKTSGSFLHEFGHYIIWFFTYRNKNKRNKIYNYLTEIYEKLFQTKTLPSDLER